MRTGKLRRTRSVTGHAVALRRQLGFTYLGLIILVTVLGMVGAATLKIDALLRRAAAEQELLFVGAAFADALTSYAAATPQGMPTQPPNLQALLKDDRSPALRRHLRKVFIDPMTGSTDWGIVWLGEHQGILAVYSKSPARPLKVANFDSRFRGFDGSLHISDWRFVANAPRPAVPPPAAATASATSTGASGGAPRSLFAGAASTAAAPGAVLSGQAGEQPRLEAAGLETAGTMAPAQEARAESTEEEGTPPADDAVDEADSRSQRAVTAGRR